MALRSHLLAAASLGPYAGFSRVDDEVLRGIVDGGGAGVRTSRALLHRFEAVARGEIAPTPDMCRVAVDAELPRQLGQLPRPPQAASKRCSHSRRNLMLFA